ncbi:MAG: hypothetical protein ABI811_07425 [Acidobacteriota bacterium]
MSRRIATILTLNVILAVGVVSTLVAQQPAGPAAEKGAVKGKAGGAAKGKAATRPTVFFRETWKQSAKGGEHPLLAENLSNPNLELKLYGNAPGEGILLTGIDGDENNPTHMWTGTCEMACMATFRHKTNFANLTGLARMKINIKTSGFHQVRPVIKTEEGMWLVGNAAVSSLSDWLVSEISFADVKWLRLNPTKVNTSGVWIENPDLSKIDEIGVVDLTPGSGHGPGGWSDIAEIEVYAASVPR